MHHPGVPNQVIPWFSHRLRRELGGVVELYSSRYYMDFPLHEHFELGRLLLLA